jgi:large subunit ribosomal protein L13
MSTTIPSGKDIKRKWFVLDASGKTLGRLATQAASILAGKLNPLYTPYIDMGDHVVIINAEKIVLTGLKGDQKLYRRYTGFPGGLREESFIKLLARRPRRSSSRPSRACCPSPSWAPDGHQAQGLQGRTASAPRAAAGPMDFHASNAPKVSPPSMVPERAEGSKASSGLVKFCGALACDRRP